MVQGKSNQDFKYDWTEYKVRQTEDSFQKYINWIGKLSFGIAYDQLQIQFNIMEHEHRIEKKNAFLLDTLDTAQESVLNYFPRHKFPDAKMDFVNFKVEIFRKDILYLIRSIFNTYPDISWEHGRIDPDKVSSKWIELYTEDWEQIGRFYNLPIEEAIKARSDKKPYEKIDYSDLLFWIHKKIILIFVDVVVYTELHQYLKNSQNNGKNKENDITYSQLLNKKLKQSNNNFSHKQIAIAYCVLGDLITTENASSILQKYSQNKSVVKLLQKRINKPSDLTKCSGNRTADSKHFRDLNQAKRLLSGMKIENAMNAINSIIIAFKTSYTNIY